MNSMGHLICSIIKSLLRIAGCATSFTSVTRLGDVTVGIASIAIFFGVAEVLGIVEELLDGRE